MATNLPLTLAGGYGSSIVELYVDQTTYSASRVDDTFWFVVLDLTNPSGKALCEIEWKSNTTVPQEVVALSEKDNTLLCFSFINVFANHMPAGDLYQFLIQVGAGRQLRRIEQIVEQSGSNFLDVASYQLVATLDSNDEPGFEDLNWTNNAILTCELMPVEVAGHVVYSPVQLS